MTIAEIIADLQTRGWNVSFPELEGTRAFGVRATKGELVCADGYEPKVSGSLEKALLSIKSEAGTL